MQFTVLPVCELMCTGGWCNAHIQSFSLQCAVCDIALLKFEYTVQCAINAVYDVTCAVWNHAMCCNAVSSYARAACRCAVVNAVCGLVKFTDVQFGVRCVWYSACIRL
jgi:hypothetical protein